MRRLLSLALVILTLSVPFTGFAADSGDSPALARIVKSGTLRVGTSGTQPPFSVVSKSGELIGYEIELAGLLADAMQVDLELVQKPFPVLLDALANGDVDMVMSGMTMTPKRNLSAAFVGPYIISGKTILTTSDRLAQAVEAEELDQASLRLAALENSTSQNFAELLMPKAKLTTTDEYDAAVKMLLEGKVDAVVADMPICAITMLRYPDKELAMTAMPLTIEPIGVALPAGDSLLLNMVENYLGALEMIGILEELEEDWFDDGGWLVLLP
jgi:polar amino acid transport system substrate-binding protein